MTENSPEETQSSHKEIFAKSQKNARFNPIWWLPFVAFLIITYLGINHLSSKGPLITITFNHADGLEAKKTKVKYKNVVIGRVESIQLTSDLQGVKVAVRMDKSSENLLHEKARFWVVKPRIGLKQISGLDTLIAGNYIAIDPDSNPDNNYSDEFKGLEIPPIISHHEPGLNLTLLADKASSLYPGTAVYYRGMEVGTVNRVYFSDDYFWIKADIFIAAPHDQLIKQTTQFWSSNGVSIGVGTKGLEVEMESLETVVAGGITFETPVTLDMDKQPVKNGTEYLLFANKTAAKEQNTGKIYYFVTYFNSSVKGLDVGSPVVFQGINIGKVKEVKLLFDAHSATAKIPVLFEIYENRFSSINLNNNEKSGTSPEQNTTYVNVDKLTKQLLKSGLKTQLASNNFITGSKQITLLIDKTHMVQHEPLLQEDPITGYTLIPSTLESLDAITAGVGHIVNTIDKLPLKSIADNLNAVLGDVHQQLDKIDLKQSIKQLDTLLKEGKVLSKTAQSTLKSLKYSISQLAKTTESALSGYSPDAPLYHNLNLTLDQLNDTLYSLKTVMDMLDRNPKALVFGKDKTKPPKNAYWKKDKK